MTADGVDIQGDEIVRRLLAEMGERIDDWTVTAPRIQDWITLRMQETIDSQGATEGVRIPGYGSEPIYKRFKRERLGDLTVLRWKGGKSERLYPSIVNQSHPEHVFRRSSRDVTVGTAVPYAARLVRGGTNMFGEPAPPRPFNRLGGKSRARLAQLIAIYIARGESRGNQWRR